MGGPHELYVSPDDSSVPRPPLTKSKNCAPPPSLLIMTKKVSDIFQSLHGIGQFDKHKKFKDANCTVLIEILKQQ